MRGQNRIVNLSPTNWVILVAALVKFLIHLYSAPGYGFFGDELYTIAMSRHLAFGYVDLPPLVPALVALSRALLGDSLLAMKIFPALAGSATLIFICLIAKEFGGKSFAVALSALWYLAVPIWLGVSSIFAYDSIDQLVLSAFLYALVRFLRTSNRKTWILLGLIAGIACMTKMTIPFLGPGFLIALLASKYRRDLLTPWPWLGALTCLIIIAPYLIWQYTNNWPTLEYWTAYGTARVYQASVRQYSINILMYMNPLLLPLWLAGLYRIFRPLDGTNYFFLGLLFIVTLVLMFVLHTSARMLAALFMPILAAGSVSVEELLGKTHWKKALKATTVAYLLVGIAYAAPSVLPIVPMHLLPAYVEMFSSSTFTIKEFVGVTSYYPPLLSGRLHWEELVQDVAGVYDELPPKDRAVAGIYADWYMSAAAIDQFGSEYGLPHAVSGSLTYYLWGPGYSWDVMLIVTDMTNEMDIFFEECELAAQTRYEYDRPVGQPNIYVCRRPRVSADVIWGAAKAYR
ncbi:MAG: glycosyltransferase family 39 protein [Anaerolineae bacterium]|nr:glycosyltransferase family 39 protein [Anaerolineae bacterium]